MTFRKSRNVEATAAYRAMDIEQFEGINARQQWSNWRTIPRTLSGLLPSARLQALDLCCGTGQSTEVLATYLPAGSTILGLEFNPEFVKKARKRTYKTLEGVPQNVTFRSQSVLEQFHNEEGIPIPSSSLDLVNSSGAIGFHFRPEELDVLTREVWRVLKPGALAAIDAGVPGPRRWAILRAFSCAGFVAIRRSRSCALDPYIHVAFRKPA